MPRISSSDFRPARHTLGVILIQQKKWDEAALDVLRGMGVDLIPVELPDLPYDAMRIILTAEAAA
mgnify:CR=1 FL=1